jgi:hypothetical protein
MIIIKKFVLSYYHIYKKSRKINNQIMRVLVIIIIILFNLQLNFTDLMDIRYFIVTPINFFNFDYLSFPFHLLVKKC